VTPVASASSFASYDSSSDSSSPTLSLSAVSVFISASAVYSRTSAISAARCASCSPSDYVASSAASRNIVCCTYCSVVKSYISPSLSSSNYPTELNTLISGSDSTRLFNSIS